MATFWSSANVEPKRKFKFLVRISPPNGSDYDIPSFVVKKVDKPGFTITETKHTFLGHNFFFPGKLEWKEINMTIVDPAGTGKGIVAGIETSAGGDRQGISDYASIPDMSQNLTKIIGLFGYQSPVIVGQKLNGGSVNTSNTIGGTEIKSFSKAGSVNATGNVEILQLDDDGNIVEIWTLRNAWVRDVQFGSNDYSSDEAQEVTIKFRYDWAEFTDRNARKASYVNE
jgi:hypothetical protein